MPTLVSSQTAVRKIAVVLGEGLCPLQGFSGFSMGFQSVFPLPSLSSPPARDLQPGARLQEAGGEQGGQEGGGGGQGQPRPVPPGPHPPCLQEEPHTRYTAFLTVT